MRRAEREVEREIRLIERAIAVAREQYRQGKRSLESLRYLERQAQRDLADRRALLRGFHRGRSN